VRPPRHRWHAADAHMMPAGEVNDSDGHEAKEFSSLGRKLLPILPGYAVKGAMILAQPIEPVVRGLHFDGSSHDADIFYIYVFYMPLCVPCRFVHLTFGSRLRQLNGWGLFPVELTCQTSDIPENAARKIDLRRISSGVSRHA
jgi:hypothetical protein